MKTTRIPAKNERRSRAEVEAERVRDLDEQALALLGEPFAKTLAETRAVELAKSREKSRETYSGVEVILSHERARPITADMLARAEARDRDQAIAAGRTHAYRTAIHTARTTKQPSR